MRRARSYLAGAAALAAGLCPVTLQGQIPEPLGGAFVEGALNFRIRSNDGDPEFRTGIDLGLRTANRTQLLRFSGDFGYTVPLEEIDAAEAADPRYQFEYLRDTGRSRISASAFFQRRDVEGTAIIFDPATDPEDFDEIDFVEDDGTLERRRASIEVEWGLDDPLGGSLGYSLDETDYSGTEDPDLTDTRTTTVSGSLRVDADRTLRFVLDASRRLTEEDDFADSETEVLRAGLGASWQMTPALGFEGRLGWTEIEETLSIAETSFVDQETGVEATLGFTLDRPNGNWTFGYDRAVTSVGLQDTLRFGRTLELPRGAVVTASLGARAMPSGETYATGSLDYARETRRGEIGLSFDRTAEVNSDDDEVLRSRISASYGEDLPNGASWSIAGSFRESDFTNPAEPDLATGQLSLDYAHPLTEDWAFRSGIQLRETRETGSESSRSTNVFLSLERRFALRP